MIICLISDAKIMIHTADCKNLHPFSMKCGVLVMSDE